MQKIALVTGAASGIGRACAERFTAAGMTVAAIDLAVPADTAAAAWWSEPVDISKPAQVDAAVDAVIAQFGQIDILVNAAGIGGSGAYTHETSHDELARILAVNLSGAIYLTQSVLRSMLPRKSGAIVHVASVAGMEGAPGHMPYSAAKGGLINATRSMAWEYGRHGIRVNCICPGLIRTPMTDGLFAMEDHLHQMVHWSALRRWGNPQEIATAAEFLTSDQASFITGHALVVDGGWTAGRDQIPPRGSNAPD